MRDWDVKDRDQTEKWGKSKAVDSSELESRGNGHQCGGWDLQSKGLGTSE